MAELRVKGTGTLKLFENDNTSSVTIASPASLGGDRTVTLPDADVTLVSGTMSTGLTAADITGQTALGAEPADTDEFVLSDAGVLKRVDYSYLKATNTPAVLVTDSVSQSIATATHTLVTFDTETIDTDSAFASNVFTVPSGEDGMYFISFRGAMEGIDTGEFIQLRIYLNGVASAFFESRMTAYTTDVEFKFSSSGALNLSAGDTISYYVYQNSGDSQDFFNAGLYIFKLIGA